MNTITDNQVMIDVIGQHFFKDTPAFFALSYFSLYLDYKYLKGGTGSLISEMAKYIESHGGEIKTETRIVSINAADRAITDQSGNTMEFDEMIWAADSKTLYAHISDVDRFPMDISDKIKERHDFLSDKVGGDSVLSLYLTVDLEKAYFGNISNPHVFYTPEKIGLSTLPLDKIQDNQGLYMDSYEHVFNWLREFFKITTYEISIPVLRDESLAPIGKTGLIISTLLDYSLVKHMEKMGWYDEFKLLSQEEISSSLIHSIYPELEGHIIDGFVSTPLTIEKRTGNSDGAITGWAFTNDTMPAVSSMPKIAKSIETPIPHIVQAGQWSYSPAGLPICILTGKLAADHVEKELRD